MIKTIRKKYGNMTQEEFAEFCEVSKATVSNMEQGFPVGKQSLLKVLQGAIRLIEGPWNKSLDHKKKRY